MIARTISQTSVSFYVPGRGTFTFPRTHKRAAEIIEALDKGLIDIAIDIMQAARKIGDLLGVGVDFDNIAGIVRVDGRDLPTLVSTKALAMIEAGHPIRPLALFLRKLNANPSYKSREQGLLFIDKLGFPIFDDGDFLGYKAVRTDLHDIHTGRYNNSPGATIEMPRAEVNDDRDVACAAGLHVGTLGYAKSFGGATGKIVVVKVNPRDIVSVPKDHNDEKLRCCRYTVVSVFEGETELDTNAIHAAPPRPFSPDDDDDDEDLDWDEDNTPDW